MRTCFALMLWLVLFARVSEAQSDTTRFQIGAQVAWAVSGAFTGADVGGGVRFAWHPTRILGAETELDFYPRDFPGQAAFSRSRLEALFGVTIGPRLGRLRPFGKLRPGLVAFHEAPGPFACILIFPPPLSCSLGAGATVFALDAGGGLEFLPAGRAFLRVDVSDRLMRYPGAIVSHDFRFGFGGGVRF